MPRTISEESKARVAARHNADPEALGPALGVVILASNVPPAAVAQLLTTTEATVYRWMYGETEPRSVFHANIRKLIAILKRALKAGAAPLSGPYKERMAAMPDLIVAFKPKPKGDA